jgi:hypothetical protein
MTGQNFNGFRRSAGMRGDPRAPRPEAEISSAPPPRAAPADAPPPAVFRSKHPRPQILMGEVVMPKARGQDAGPGREALRAFMRAHHLAPTKWAKDAGVPLGEILGYLTGRTRILSDATTTKLAHAAGVTPADLLRP